MERRDYIKAIKEHGRVFSPAKCRRVGRRCAWVEPALYEMNTKDLAEIAAALVLRRAVDPEVWDRCQEINSEYWHLALVDAAA